MGDSACRRADAPRHRSRHRRTTIEGLQVRELAFIRKHQMMQVALAERREGALVGIVTRRVERRPPRSGVWACKLPRTILSSPGWRHLFCRKLA